MSLQRFIVFDTETTGLSRELDRIVEVAAMEFDPKTGKTGRYFHTQINPQRMIPAKLSALHGITNAMVANKPVFAEVGVHFIDFIRGATIVAHNAPFDTGFLDAEFARLGLGQLQSHAASVVCTRSMARKALPGRKATLDALCDWYQVDRSARNLHGALIDCQLLARVYPHLNAQLANPLPALPKPAKTANASAPVRKDSVRNPVSSAETGLERLVHKVTGWFAPSTSPPGKESA